MKNLGLKIFCLGVAIVLARFVHSRDNSSVVSVLVPLEIQGLPPSKVIIWPLSRQVQVTVQGPSFLLGKLAQSPPTLRIELPEAADYRFSAKLSEHQLELNPAVRVVGIEPPAIDFRLDDVENRNVPVVVPRIGQLPDDYTLEELKVAPPTVVVQGPKTEINDLERVESPPVDLRGVRKSGEFRLALQAPGKLSRVDPPEVLVQLSVSVVNTTRTFAAVPVELRTVSGNGLKISPEAVEVTVQGPRERLDALTLENVVAFIRPGLEEVAGQVEVKVDLPQGVRLVRVDPPRVTVAGESAGNGANNGENAGKEATPPVPPQNGAAQ